MHWANRLACGIAAIGLVGASAAVGAEDCDSGVQVARGVFAERILDREPGSEPAALTPSQGQVYFFSELLGAAGTTVTHRWLLNGEGLASVDLQIGSNRWRTWSRKTLYNLSPGTLSVRVSDEDGCLLAEAALSVHADDAKPAMEVASEEAASAEAASEEAASEEAASEEAASGTSVSALERQALAWREEGRFEDARANLEAALAQVAEESAEWWRLADELNFHLLLARARVHIRNREPDPLRALLQEIDDYLDTHPQWLEYRRILHPYRVALFHLDR